MIEKYHGLDLGACGAAPPGLSPEQCARLTFVRRYYDPRSRVTFHKGQVVHMSNVSPENADYFFDLHTRTDGLIGITLEERPQEVYFVPHNNLCRA